MSAEVAPGVHRIGGPFVGMYLLVEGGRATLVDAGTPRDRRRLERTLAAAGLGLDAVEAVLLTHAHPDHLGLAERLRADQGVPVEIHRADVAMATGVEPFRLSPHLPWWRPSVTRTLVAGLFARVPWTPPVREVVVFDDGEVLDVPGRPRVIHAPGHTAGSCVLYAEARRVLFVGDVLATVDIVTGREGPVLSPSFANVDDEQALASLDRLDGIVADVLLPGHGRPWTGGVAEALTHARRVGIHP